MSDTEPPFDDISAVWGPADDGVLHDERPAAGRTTPPQADIAVPEVPPVDADRLRAVEESVSRLTRFTKAFCDGLEAKVVDELARIRTDTATATEAALARFDTRLTQRLEEMGRDIAAVPGRAAVVHQMIGPEADRVDDLERQLHEGLTRLHRTIQATHAQVQLHAQPPVEALEVEVRDVVARLTGSIEAQNARFVPRAEMQALWETLRAAVAEGLTLARARADAAADAGVASAKAELVGQLSVIETRVAALTRVVAALQPDAAGAQ